MRSKVLSKLVETQPMEDFELELKEEFLTEAEDLLEAAEAAFLKLEQARDNLVLVDEIFRLAHNIKGSSRAVGFGQLSEITHAAENVLLKVKSQELEITDDVISALFDFKDVIADAIGILRSDPNAAIATEEIISKLEQVAASSGQQWADLKSSDSTEPAEPAPESETKNESDDGFGSGLHLFEEEGPPTPDTGTSAPTPAATPAPAPPKESAELKPAKKKQESKSKSADEETIRVSLNRIDQLNNILGELVILQTVMEQRRFHHIKDEVTNQSITQMTKLFKEAQELSMSLRMLPLKTVFQKMSRITRDVSKALEKDVDLVITGENTEVDKTVLERISDPLVHIVRNAIDHGLETKEQRTNTDKPPKGRVDLEAYHEGSNLVIEVRDDGRGIDPEVIRRKALEKGVIKAQADLTDEQVINLIFHPGFSTAEKVSEVSGRGVGMDVVLTNVQMIGGEVKLTSKLGEGSRFKIVLPLTLAITDGMIVKSGEEKYIISMAQIFEINQVRRKDIESFEGRGKLFRLRGEVLPLFSLNGKLGQKSKVENTDVTVIVVRKDDSAFGVAVQDVLHQQQIVVKNLGRELRNLNGVSGSAILGDGKPSFIIDLFEMFLTDIQNIRKRDLTRRAS